MTTPCFQRWLRKCVICIVLRAFCIWESLLRVLHVVHLKASSSSGQLGLCVSCVECMRRLYICHRRLEYYVARHVLSIWEQAMNLALLWNIVLSAPNQQTLTAHRPPTSSLIHMEIGDERFSQSRVDRLLPQ